MATTALEQGIIELERLYWKAVRDRDAEAIQRLSDDPCIVAGAQGHAQLDAAQISGMMESPTWTLHEFEIGDDAVVREINGDVAVIAYTVMEKMTVDGKALTLRAADASTWVRRDGEWRCALHTESLLGDPFGRDRKPVPAK